MESFRQEIKTINIYDNDNVISGVIIVNIFEREIGLCVSARENGDAEVWLSMDQCNQVIEYLYKALAVLKNEHI